MLKEELEKLIFIDGLSYEEIGRRFNVTGSTIRKRAKKFGFNLPKKRKVNESENFNRDTNLVYKLNEDEFIRIINESTNLISIVNKIGYKLPDSKIKELIFKRCEELGVEISLKKVSKTNELTKGDLFRNRANWQSARSSIQKLARKCYFDETKEPKCHICGYDKHVEVAHIKAVSEFSDDTLISEINSIDNLIGLCPNHHWEYDNGILKI